MFASIALVRVHFVPFRVVYPKWKGLDGLAIEQRLSFYRQIEAHRKRPLIVFVTSSRQNAEAAIGGDAVHEFELQLESLPTSANALDLLLVSNGGDPTVAWRVVSLIRERVSDLSVLIPAGAFSAATLIALGANSLVMHPNGNLGPVDPQIKARHAGPKDGKETLLAFGSEDLSAFITYARDSVGLTDQVHLSHAFEKFCDQVGAIPIGIAARSSQLSLSMAESLLKMHMTRDEEERKAKSIADQLSRKFYHHGYALSRKEANDIGLPVEKANPSLESWMWEIWLDFVSEFEMRTPFNPLTLVQADPNCAALFGPIPSLAIPPGMPPQVTQTIVNQITQQAVVMIPATPYRLLQASIESIRAASHYLNEGAVFAGRQADFQIKLSVATYRQGWQTVQLPMTERPIAPERSA